MVGTYHATKICKITPILHPRHNTLEESPIPFRLMRNGKVQLELITRVLAVSLPNGHGTAHIFHQIIADRCSLTITPSSGKMYDRGVLQHIQTDRCNNRASGTFTLRTMSRSLVGYTRTTSTTARRCSSCQPEDEDKECGRTYLIRFVNIPLDFQPIILRREGIRRRVPPSCRGRVPSPGRSETPNPQCGFPPCDGPFEVYRLYDNQRYHGIPGALSVSITRLDILDPRETRCWKQVARSRDFPSPS